MCSDVIYKEKFRLAYSIYPYKKNGNWKHLKFLCFPLSDLKQFIYPNSVQKLDSSIETSETHRQKNPPFSKFQVCYFYNF